MQPEVYIAFSIIHVSLKKNFRCTSIRYDGIGLAERWSEACYVAAPKIIGLAELVVRGMM